jgi:hypothetical protein
LYVSVGAVASLGIVVVESDSVPLFAGSLIVR